MQRIELVPVLTQWLDRKLPALGGLRKIRVYSCRKLPFEAFYCGQRYSGLTLWNRIYIRETYAPMEPENIDFVGLLLHELLHVQQFKASPLLCPLKYMYYTARHGYWENPMETVVYEQAEVLLAEYRTDRPWL